MNLEFFELLYEDRGFCESMGKMTLAAGRFESNVKMFLRLKGIAVSDRESSLGPLIGLLQSNGLLSENGVRVLRDLKRQRNYLYHSLFDLFAGRIPETALPRTNLVPLDVQVFAEKTRALEDNLHGLSKIVEGRITALTEGADRCADADLLFHP